MLPNKTILVAPLDWGIGHASRCIPIIKELLRLNQEVIVAADGAPYELLRKAFPELRFEVFPSFTPHYSKGSSLFWSILKQIPILLRQMVKDHRWVENFVRNNKIDGIISDNRFGAYSTEVKSVFITHQLHIKPPDLLAFSALMIEFVNKMIIRNYSSCWVPDFEGKRALAGQLSNPPFKHISTKYIGPLSRFEALNSTIESKQKDIDFLIMLSGPEPQRTLLENKVLDQLKGRDESVVILRGLPLAKDIPTISPNIKLLNHAVDDQLYELISNARTVVARAGYSTIMDLVALRKPALLIPTPGQTEQEYLAEYHENNGLFQRKLQSDDSFFDASFNEDAGTKNYTFQESRLSEHLAGWISSL
ncbi:MAG: glycosyl transferase family protein [Bacteroidetes bacterium]|nr:MAG: glycosyl transferase family protein [Bacteroidota bacterium]